MDKERNLDEYVAGLVDGEGCFALTLRRDVRHERKDSPIYFSWKAMFVVVLRKDDEQLLTLIQKKLACGGISYSKNSARLQVAHLDELAEKVVPFFEKHLLLGKKGYDFSYWKEAVAILHSHKTKKTPWQEGELRRLQELHLAMVPYKSAQKEGSRWFGNTVGRSLS